MQKLIFAALASLGATPALAQDDCIENIVGRVVCGQEADAVRARIRAEGAWRQDAEQGAPKSEALPVENASYAKAAQTAPRPASARKGSVYGSFSRRAFVRGGTAFAGGGAEFGRNVIGSAGAGFDLGQHGLSVETELVVQRDRETLSDPLLGTFTAKVLGLAGLLSLRYDLPTDAGINPFASVGVGPGYLRASLDDGVTSVSDSEFTFAYSGRAGVAIDLSERWGLEAAYRYIDTTLSGTRAQHSVELGLALGF